MNLSIMTDVNWLLVGDAEVNPYHRPFIALPQFADPLVRGVEIAGHRGNEYATRKCARSSAHPCDAISVNPCQLRLRSQVNNNAI
jgi:hypothetical protein